ncbi:hypothetical protein [Kineococcus rubinsiae]|uniref:hypothetical protein n=1 Tax=Kineococcus rubinsiae TaxID=2609562 RepID=UPI001431C42B|nr:hypothetical protein [Kineococcus rubinsiae]NIZ90279.1 hypothetical protein [Kineococcus rubinsiae]
MSSAASDTPRPAQQRSPARRYSGNIYETVSGFPTADDLMRACLEGARATIDDLTARAPEISSDPYFQGDLEHAQGAIEGFTALLDVARQTPRPALDAPMRALDDDGQLIAEVTFNMHIETTDGAYALASATLPHAGGAPMLGDS